MVSKVDEDKNKLRLFFKETKFIDTILGKVEIEEEIGQGGNALVFSAIWGRTQVAIKFLAEDCSIEATSRHKRFVTEVREVIKLSDSQAVVPIYFYDLLKVESSIFPYMIMKKYPYTLNAWKRKNQINQIDDVLPIVKNLLYCLDKIHSMNIVHRDLKPQNLLVDDDNDLVLADFGISWFDPEHYERLVKTEKKDRLANFAFSAPEQFQVKPETEPTMDLFALGQLIQWLITDDTVRGVGRTQLKSVHESFAPLDPIVDLLLQYDPINRPQNATEVSHLLNSALKPIEVRESEEDRVLNALRGFDEILRSTCPGKTGLIKITEKQKIDLIMSRLADQYNKLKLWWTQGSSDCPIDNIRLIDENIWLFDSSECLIEAIWVKRDHSYDHQYILLQCAAMPPFGIYEYYGQKTEEAAWFMDNYITRQEYDDGYAEINGVIEKLSNRAEIRIRELERDFLFVATFANPINVDTHRDNNREIVDNVYHFIKDAGEVDESQLKRLDKLQRHPISVMMS
ncbi:protein kinase [Paenibacillus sonchi]|uniref:Protein kinase n=1 Tax=Paenibacillus sonchi TaxID=373687 RepID=A0A974SCD7_9BACL|nr:protein kinase [Paenibacillus sonchi]QQZ60234.1 protein kinase [Paenibacillus sonchi]